MSHRMPHFEPSSFFRVDFSGYILLWFTCKTTRRWSCLTFTAPAWNIWAINRDILKCPCDQKNYFLFFFRLWKCLLSTLLAKFWALIFTHRPFTLSVSFGFHDPPLLTFKTDRLDLRGLDPGKSDVKGSPAENSSVWTQLIIYAKRKFKSVKAQNSRVAY